MGLLFERRATPEHPNAELTSSMVEALFLGDSTHAGTRVTPKKAMGLTALWAAHRILAGTIGYLPFKVLERLDSGGRREAPNHPLYSVLHTRANPEMPAQIYRETCQGHLLNYGNTYAEVQRDRAGRARWLWPLLPDRTRVERNEAKVKLCITRLPSGQEIALPPGQYVHIPGMGFDGLRGYSPLSVMRQAAGLGLALEEFAAKWFGQGSHLGGFLETEGKLSDEARKRVKASIPILYEGLSNAHRMAILEEGLSFKPLSVPPEDAQFLESRKFQIAEFSRMTGVPVHMLADVDRPFQSNVEHMGIELVVYVLSPWVRRWETVTEWELMPERDRARYYTKLSMDALLRGDFKTRTEGYDRAIKGGWLTPNQALALEDMNPIESDYGDSYQVPQNVSLVGPDGVIVPVNQPEPRSSEIRASGRRELPAAPEEREINQGGARARQRISRSFVGLFEREAGRLVGGEVKAVGRAVDEVLGLRGRDAFLGWLEDYYGERTQEFARDAMSGAITTYFLAIAREAAAEAGLTLAEDEFERQVKGFAGEYLETFALRHTGKSLNALRKVLDEEANDDVAAESLRTRLDEWSETRAAKVAGKETNKGNGMATLFTFALAGVSRVIWVHLGESCPLCKRMHGRTVEVRRPFVQPGDTIPGDDTTSDLEVKQVISHPPLHAGCDCGIAAG